MSQAPTEETAHLPLQWDWSEVERVCRTFATTRTCLLNARPSESWPRRPTHLWGLEFCREDLVGSLKESIEEAKDLNRRGDGYSSPDAVWENGVHNVERQLLLDLRNSVDSGLLRWILGSRDWSLAQSDLRLMAETSRPKNFWALGYTGGKDMSWCVVARELADHAHLAGVITLEERHDFVGGWRDATYDGWSEAAYEDQED